MRLLLSAVLASILVAPAAGRAAELAGTWQRDKGNMRVAFAPCGPDLCGKIVWLDPAVKTRAHIGDRVFYDLTRTPSQSWQGKSFSPQEGKTYSVILSFQGALLQSHECMFGDKICRTEIWQRIKG